jgi:hypothetical protein
MKKRSYFFIHQLVLGHPHNYRCSNADRSKDANDERQSPKSGTLDHYPNFDRMRRPFHRGEWRATNVLNRYVVVLACSATAIGFAFSGCRPEMPPKNFSTISTPGAPAVADHAETDSYSYDAGRIICGQTITHTFDFRNLSKDTIRLQGDTDIQRNCGCTSLTPEKRALGPGDATRIRVEVRTGALAGAFERGGQLVWTSSEGAKRAVGFSLRGRAMTAFVAEPELVSFEPIDVKQSITKNLRFSSSLPIDWSTFRLTSSSQDFEIIDSVTQASGVECKIRCRLPEDVESLEGQLFATGLLRAGASCPVPSGSEVASVVPIRAMQAIGLQISPNVLIFNSSKAHAATAKAFIRAQGLSSGSTFINEISCPGRKVAWQIHRATGCNTAILTLELIGQKTEKENDDYLFIQFREGGRVRIPFVFADRSG